MFLEIPIFNANNVYPDRTLRSDLGLYCLLDARHNGLTCSSASEKGLLSYVSIEDPGPLGVLYNLISLLCSSI